MEETQATSPVMAEEKSGFKCSCGSSKIAETKNPDVFKCGNCGLYYKKRLNPRVAEKKPQRNDKCYCGSGKKYKICHLNK